MHVLQLAVLSVAICIHAQQHQRLTPFGAFHPSCVVEVPSGTVITDRQDKFLLLQYPNNTASKITPCRWTITKTSSFISRHSHTTLHNTATMTPAWNGWYSHTWFGSDYATWTNTPLTQDVTVFSATFVVPPIPVNTSANPSSPWPWAPTLSYWIGLQSDAGPVLQPVLEYNGLLPQQWDLSSWNCCPQGYVFHSPPIPVNPGDQVYGSVTQDSTYVYDIVSKIGNNTTSLLKVDLNQISGWSPRWIEVIVEAYYVTNCNQLPSLPGRFFNLSLQTTGGVVSPPLIPWQQTFECEGVSCSTAVCSGTTAIDLNDGDVSVGFVSSSNCTWEKMAGYIPTGSTVFSGQQTIPEALSLCINSGVCAGITLNLDSKQITDEQTTYYIFGKSYTEVIKTDQWVTYIKTCT